MDLLVVLIRHIGLPNFCDKLKSLEKTVSEIRIMGAMDKLAAMQVFVKVVENGSLSSASRALGFAPWSVTRRIRELEDFHGVTLLHRTTRKLNLTEAGETYFEQVEDIVQAVEKADLAVTQKRAELSGTLRITTPSRERRRLAQGRAWCWRRNGWSVTRSAMRGWKW